MIFSGTHTDANKETDKKTLLGTFAMNFETGEVTLTVDISNAEFSDVLFAFQECRDEFQRQIDNKEKCPFYPNKRINKSIQEWGDYITGQLSISGPEQREWLKRQLKLVVEDNKKGEENASQLR